MAYRIDRSTLSIIEDESNVAPYEKKDHAIIRLKEMINDEIRDSTVWIEMVERKIVQLKTEKRGYETRLEGLKNKLQNL